MSWLPVGISIMAADLSAITLMGLPGWSFKNNLQLAWLVLAPWIAAPVIIHVFVPFYAGLNLYTAYEYLERRFNVTVRLVASALFQFLRVVHVAIAIYAPAIALSLVTGLPVWQCVLLMGFEWGRQGSDVPPEVMEMGRTEFANGEEVGRLGDHFEERLAAAGFFYPEGKAAGMKLSLRNMWSRLGLTRAEVQTFHGMLRQIAYRLKKQGE